MSGPENDKNPFPAWMRRLDPNLELAATNQIFQAFAEWRRTHPSWQSLLLALQVALLTACFAGFSKLVPALGPYSFYLFLLYAVISVSDAIMGIRGRKRRMRQMRRVTLVAFMPIQHKELLSELWSTTTNGALIVEAVYLEQKQAVIRGLPWFFLILVLFSWSYLAWNGMELPHLAAIMGLLAYALVPLYPFFCGAGALSLEQTATVLRDIWRRPTGLAFLSMGFSTAIYLLIGASLVTILLLIDAGHLAVGAVALGIAFVILLRAVMRPKTTEEDRARVTDEVNAAYETLIRTHVLEVA